jgi:hypothetical protein
MLVVTTCETRDIYAAEKHLKVTPLDFATNMFVLAKS